MPFFHCRGAVFAHIFFRRRIFIDKRGKNYYNINNECVRKKFNLNFYFPRRKCGLGFFQRGKNTREAFFAENFEFIFYFLANFEKKMGELRPKTERKNAAVKLVFWRERRARSAPQMKRACGT